MKAHLGNQPVQVLEKSKNWWTNKFFENAGWTQNEDGAWTGRSRLLVSRYGTSTGGFFGSGMNITQQMTISFIAKYDPVSPTAAVGMIIRVNYTDGSRTDKYIDTTEYSKYIVTSTYGKVIDSIVVAYGQGDNIIYFKDVQIELGTTATEYAPYIRRFNFHSPVNLWKKPTQFTTSNVYIRNGITWTYDEETGWVTANGTATEQSYISCVITNLFGRYLLRGIEGGSYTTYRLGILPGGDLYNQGYVIFNIASAQGQILPTVMKGATVNNLVFKPELIKLLGD